MKNKRFCLTKQLTNLHRSEKKQNYNDSASLDGKVERLKTDQRLPQIGWNYLETERESPIFKGIDNGYVYYAHSYHAKSKANRIATSDYGSEVTAASQKDNVFGTQFHPEKSGKLGLKILNNFLRL